MNLKASVGSAIIPILSAIIPYIKAVIDWFVVLFNTVARVLALFFNVNINMASTEATAGGVADATGTAADNAGDLAGNTKKAEKAAKGALAAFDEINVLQQDTADAGGGGGGKPSVPGAPPVGGADIGAPKDLIPDALLAKIEKFKEYLTNLFAPAIKSFENLKASLAGLGQTIWNGLVWVWENILRPLAEWSISDFLPVFIDLLAAGIDVLNSALAALQPLGQWLFDNFLKPAAEWTGQVIIDALKWLTDRLNDLSTWINENQAVLQTIAAIIGIVAAAFFLANIAVAAWTAIAGLGTVITGAFAAVMGFLASPVVLVTLAILALIAIVYLLITYWPQISEAATTAWEWIVSIWSIAAAWFQANVINPIISFFTPFWNLLYILANNALVLIKFVWNAAAGWFHTNVIAPLVSFFTPFWELIKSLASTAWAGIKQVWEIASTWFKNNVLDPLESGFNLALGAIKDAWEITFTAVEGVVKGAINSIIGFINSMLTGLVQSINFMITELNKVGSYMPGWMNLPYVPMLQIPYLATGAVIPPNSQFLAVLGDQRSGRNLEAPENLIRQIVREESGQNGGGEITLRFEGTMGELIRVMKPYIVKETARVGNSLVQGGLA
jgi:hypothetical protein